MSKNRVVSLETPVESSRDFLTEYLREKSIELLRVALEHEVSEFIEGYSGELLSDGRRSVVRNGYQPERVVQTGIGELPVRVPKTRDRSGSEINFRSFLLPPYLRRSQQLDELIPWLYLKGVSTGEMQSALESLLGEGAKNLSASVVSRLKSEWIAEHREWEKRNLSKTRYVYMWADGVYFNVRSEDSKHCILVLLGVRDDGVKELIGFSDGFRESEASWTALLESLKTKGLKTPPELGIGDGALGFWKALRKVFPTTKHQRCWVHKMRNILDKLPHGVQGEAKKMLQNIWMAETKADALTSYKLFIKRFRDKYPKAVHCLEKDKEELFSFYSFPAKHWQHIRTTNPIESIFSSVKLRTGKTRGMLSSKTLLALIFKLIQSSEKRWRKIQGFKRLAEVISGVKFSDGITDVEKKELMSIKIAA